MRVLVLGVNGFIGNALTRRILTTTPWEVYGLDVASDRIAEFLPEKRFRFLEGDIAIGAEVAKRQAAQGFPLVKLRLAGDRGDLARLRAVRDALPAGIDMAADANEKCDLARAQWLARACAGHGLLWLEEPLPALDYAGHETLARTAPLPIATGEHLQGLAECLPLYRAGACAIVQPDFAAMGGITECLRVSQAAEAFGIASAPHFLPALFVHMAAAAPNVTWLEDFPLLEPLFDIGVRIDARQRMAPGDRPGHGLAWKDGARAEFRVPA